MPKPGWEVPLNASAAASDKTPSIHLAALGTLLALYAAPDLRRMLLAVAASESLSLKRKRTGSGASGSRGAPQPEPVRDEQHAAGEPLNRQARLEDEDCDTPTSDDEDAPWTSLAAIRRWRKEADRASEKRVRESREIERVAIALFVAHTERRVGAAGV